MKNRNQINVINGLLLFMILLLLSACHDGNPLTLLQSTAFDASLNNAYWQTVEKEQPDVWEKAKAYCFAHGDNHPNCDAVTWKAMGENSLQTAPAIGHSGQSVSLPTHLQ